MLRQPSSPSPATASPAAVATPPEASAGRRFTDVAGGGSIFGPKLHVRGSITGTDAVEIAGQVEGPIEVEGLLHVTEGARVTGPISATDAVIEGELQGRLTARGRIELRATAKVRADVHAATVAIAEGCFFDGRIHMGGEGDGGPTRFREKRRRRGRGAGSSEAATAPAATEPVVAAPPVAEAPAAVAVEPAEPAAPQPAATEPAPSAPAAAGPATPAIRPIV